MALTRLDKLIADSGRATRSEAKALIRAGRITVNGALPRRADEKYDPDTDCVALDGEALCCAANTYLMLHKPGGVLSATEDRRQETVLDLLTPELRRQGLFPVGRLDKDTTGLLILTNDGDLAHRVISPKKHVSKVYIAAVDAPLDESDIAAFAEGLTLSDGTACLPAALELLRRGTPKKIVMIEQGQAIENRRCPKAKTGRCMNCKPYCHITTGFSGAGAFSDGKLSLCSDVGGDLPTLVGEQKAQELIDYADSIYLEFGADEHVEGLENTEEVKRIRTRAIRAGLRLVDCPIRHLGTEKAHEVYLGIENYLRDHGVEMLFGCTCEDVILRDGRCCGVVAHDGHQDYTIEARHTVIATGRRGADWLEKVCLENGVEHKPGTVDIGVRVEVRNEIMESVNRVLYESKLIGYPAPFKNKVRTFCQNPGGFVSQENYDNDLAVVNGHAYKELKSPNTNVAILCSHNFSVPFNQPIAYAQKVGELTNMLGAGHIMVQRFGDILDGKRTWQKELMQSNVRPTLPDAVAGDITSAMPYRAMLNIINFIKAMDEVVPGFAAYETLLYSPELKFYSNRIAMDDALNTNVPGLHCLGDSSGWTRGLMMASAMGVLMGRRLADML